MVTVDLAARITSWPPGVTLLLIAGLYLGFVNLALWGRRRLIGHPDLARSMTLAGPLFIITAMLNTFFLGFVMVVELGNYNRAQGLIDQEASNLMEVIRLAEAWPALPPEARTLRGAAPAYAQAVLEQELPAMANLRPSPQAEQAMMALWRAAGALAPVTPRDATLLGRILGKIETVQDARMARIHSANEGTPGFLWPMILALSVTVLSFSTLFPTERGWLERFMTNALALVIALVVFTILQLNYPFIGGTTVGVNGLRQVVMAGTGVGRAARPESDGSN
jgi:hypothetical protein